MTAPETQEEWVPIERVAEHLAVHVETVRRLQRNGMPHVKLSPGKSGGVRFRISEVDQWLSNRPTTEDGDQ